MTTAVVPPIGEVRAAHSRRRKRWAAACGVALIIGLITGVSTATATANLGPHEAEYRMVWSNKVVVDLGPLGTLRIPSPLPAGLGLTVTVKEIPEDLGVIAEADDLGQLGNDLDAYVQFLTSPQATVSIVTHRLIVDMVQRALMTAALIMLSAVGVRALLGGQRRRELLIAIRGERRRLTFGTACVVVVAVSVTGASVEHRPVEPAASPVFASTPLAGTEVTGRLGALLDTYGSKLLTSYHSMQHEYDRIEAATVRAWQKRADSVASGVVAPEGHTVVTMVMTSDLHCNVGMARVVKSIAELAKAGIVVDGGDITISGTTVEDYCVKSFAAAVPRGAAWVTVTGNHDSPTTASQEKASGAHVLRGKIDEVDGIRFLGDNDTYRTVIGSPSVSTGIAPSDQATKLSSVACDGDVDILLLHRPAVAEQASDEGCIPVTLSGHLHRRIGPLVDGGTVRFVNGTSGGAAQGIPTIGKLGTTAEITVLRFDTTEHRMLDSQLVTVTTAGVVTVGHRAAWPVP